MKRLHKILLAVLVAALLIGAVLVVFQRQIATAALQQVAHRNVGRNVIPDLPDGLHVGLCGTGSPFPDPARAGPCTAVIAGDRLFVVDTGEGSARNLGTMGLPASKIEAILLTHFHSDHIDGMGPFLLQRWGLGTFQTPTPVYGPPGVETVVDGFRAAYVLDFGYRVAHHSAKIMPPGGSGGKGMPFVLGPKDKADAIVVLDDKGVKITAFRVDHSPVDPAVGYRFDYKGRSVVITGDTKKTPAVAANARGADLLIHEALQPKLVKVLEDEFAQKNIANTAQIMRDILNYHTTPEEAAAVATDAGVKELVFNHVVPPLPFRYVYPAFVGDAGQYFKGPMTVGEDGMLFSMPAGGSTIQKTRLY